MQMDVALKLRNLRPWSCAKEPLAEHAGADPDDMYDQLLRIAQGQGDQIEGIKWQRAGGDQ